jgi:putative zinc finger/helix-turn-helix YgiT family protein
MSEVMERKLRRRSATVCQRCSSDGAQARTYSDALDHKGLTVDVHRLQTMRCQICEHEWTTDGQQLRNIEALKAAYGVKREEVRAREGLLTGEQVKSILDALGLSSAQAAALFGDHPDAFVRYTQSEVLQSLAMDRLLRLASHVGQPAVEFLDTFGRGPLPVISTDR